MVDRINANNAMTMIAKISKGSNMDQIYIPKNRAGLPIGQYVMITSLENELAGKLGEKGAGRFKPFFYNVRDLEPLKLEIIKGIFNIVERICPENIIITGSFLEPGFKFNDIDILVIKDEKIEIKPLKDKVEDAFGIKSHILCLSNKTLALGLSTDPLYSLMLSRCVSKNRIIFNVKRTLDYKLLDFQLLKSKELIDNFDVLNGEEKYYLLMNMFSILLFIQNKKLSRETINKDIEKTFGLKIKEIRDNLIEKAKFIKKYAEIYNETFNLIMENIK
jgi:hypothetical protein